MSVHDLYIKNIKIQNYRSLEDVSITLNKGLNIIIGDNGAGKSNFLKFLDRPLAESLFTIIFGTDIIEKVRGNVNYLLEIEYKEGLDICQVIFEQITKSIKNRDKTGISPNISIQNFKNGKLLYHISEDRLNTKVSSFDYSKIGSEIRKLGLLYSRTFVQFSIPEKINYVTNPGKISFTNRELMIAEEPKPHYNITHTPSLFQSFEPEMEEELVEMYSSSKIQTEYIRERIISWFNKKKREGNYVSLLKKYSPISDIKLNENINIYEAGNQIIIENIVLNFKVNNSWVPWSYLSDGTIRLFHIITEVIFNDSNIILVEEPELGIHPNQFFKIMDFLTLQSQKKQIIISTHSPISLDVISPDELDQVIVAKMTKKGTILSHLDAKQKSKAKAYINKVGNLSSYWLHSDLEQ